MDLPVGKKKLFWIQSISLVLFLNEKDFRRWHRKSWLDSTSLPTSNFLSDIKETIVVRQQEDGLRTNPPTIDGLFPMIYPKNVHFRYELLW